MSDRPNIIDTHHVPQSVHLHFIDRELLEAVGSAPTAAEVIRFLKILLIATDSPLVCVLPHIWESFAILSPIYSELNRLKKAGILRPICTQVSFNEFILTRRELYAHDKVRYQCYYSDPPDELLQIQPVIPKRSSTTAFLLDHILDTETVNGYNSLIAYGALPGASERDLFSFVEERLRERGDEAVSFSMFSQQLAKHGDPRAGQALRRWISELYTHHYLKWIGADITTGIRGLEYFDGMANSFPLLDMPVLEKLLSLCGFDQLLQSNTLQSEWWERFIVTRGLQPQVLAADSLLQVVAAIVLRAPAVHKQSPFALRRYVVGVLSRLPAFRLPDEPIDEQLMQLASYLRSILIELDSSYVPDVGRMLMAKRSEVGDGRVLLLTATEVETDAVEEVIAERKLVPIQAGSLTVGQVGNIGPNHVFCAQSEMGSGGIGGSQMVVSELIRELKPSSVIAVGIAFGLRQDRQKLGHVLVSKQLRCYEAARVGVRSGTTRSLDIRLRGDRVTAPARMTSTARSAARVCDGISCHFGLLMSGEKLVDHPDLNEMLRKLEPEAIGGEMEGAGIYTSASTGKTDWIIVKGICDWGDGSKKSAYQRIAARKAATVVLTMLTQSAC